LLVKEVMNSEVHAVPPSTSVQTVAALMREKRIGAIVVAQERKALGIVTDRDLAVRVLAAGLVGSTSVSTVMSRELISCRPGDDVNEALRVMRIHQVRRTPVVSRERLVGIVSLCDIATQTAQYDDIEITLADLCERTTTIKLSEYEHRQLESRHI
jgi:CBS domain-containing protein